MALKLFRYFVVFITLLIASPLVAVEEPESKQGVSREAAADPQVRMKRSTKYKTRQILLSPLLIPKFAIIFATSPLIFMGMQIEKHHLYERGYDLMSNKERTFFVYPIISTGQGSGFGGGLGFVHRDLTGDKDSLRGSFQTFFNTDIVTGLSYNHPTVFHIGNQPVGIKTLFRFIRYNDEDFFGLGNNSQKANQSEFKWDRLFGGLIFDYNLPFHFHIKPHLIFSATQTGTSRPSRFPSAETVFPASQLVGFGRWINYLDIGVTVAHDTRDDENRPETGGLQQFVFQRMQGVNASGFDYNVFTLEVRQYFRLWKDRRVLGLRGIILTEQETGSSQIPFAQKATLGLPSPLRSYDRGRFRDNSYVLFNAEYRYPIWDLIDVVAFFDIGRVFDDLQDLTFKAWKYSAGGGIRMLAGKFPVFSIMVGTGREGTKVVFTTTHNL